MSSFAPRYKSLKSRVVLKSEYDSVSNVGSTARTRLSPSGRLDSRHSARRPKSAQAFAIRARIVLACAEGLSNGAAAKKLHLTGATVCKWRERFRVSRLEGLLDEPRPGAPRSITDAQVEEVVTQTLESMPVNSTHWSTRLMAEKTGLSQTAIVRIWRAFGLQPILVTI